MTNKTHDVAIAFMLLAVPLIVVIMSISIAQTYFEFSTFVVLGLAVITVLGLVMISIYKVFVQYPMYSNTVEEDA